MLDWLKNKKAKTIKLTSQQAVVLRGKDLRFHAFGKKKDDT